jgi:hypothetical protein
MQKKPSIEERCTFEPENALKFIHSGEVVWILKEFDLDIVGEYFHDCELEERMPDPEDFVDWLIAEQYVEEIGPRVYDPESIYDIDLSVK